MEMELETDTFADENAIEQYINMRGIDMFYYTYAFHEMEDGVEYVVHFGDMIQPVYEKLGLMLDNFYIDIDKVMYTGGATIEDTYYNYHIKIPPLLERRIKRIMDEFNYTYNDYRGL
jgi:hypothetical protein